jgi:hypothetical protein
MKCRNPVVRVLLPLTCVVALGCGGNLPRTVPASGKLHWEDGKPIVGANVRFVGPPGGRDATGYTGKDGEFTLSSFTQGDGAIPGDYTVVVTKTVAAPDVVAPQPGGDPQAMAKAMKEFMAKSKSAPKKIEEPIPPAYQKEKESPLKWRIESGGSDKIDLKLKRT